MNPGDSKAREGIQNVERASGGEVEQDSANDTEEHDGEGISLDEVMQKNNNKVSLAVQLKLKYTLTIFFLGGH